MVASRNTSNVTVLSVKPQRAFLEEGKLSTKNIFPKTLSIQNFKRIVKKRIAVFLGRGWLSLWKSASFIKMSSQGNRV